MQYQFSDKMRNMKPSIIREILKQMSDPALISFAGGNPAPETFPAADIAHFSAALLQDDPVGMLQYSLTEGVPCVREAMQAFANRRFAVSTPDDSLLITTGSQQALELVAKCLCNEGDTVLVEEPAFLGAYNAFRSYGAVLRGVPLCDDGVDIEKLEAALAAKPTPKFFYCIPNFQNPTGVTTSAEKRKAIYALCVQYGVPILEDDPYGELRFQGEDLPPIKALDKEGAVIYAGSFSKILCPAMRLAYCIAPKALADKLVVAKQVSDVHTNVWAQRVCAALLTSTDINAHIKALRAIYREKAQLMMDTLAAECPSLRFTPVQGGMFLWAQLPAGVDVQQFVSACLAEKLAVIPGSAFMTDTAAPCNAIRLNFSTASKENICKGIAIMKTVLARMQ